MIAGVKSASVCDVGAVCVLSAYYPQILFCLSCQASSPLPEIGEDLELLTSSCMPVLWGLSAFDTSNPLPLLNL